MCPPSANTPLLTPHCLCYMYMCMYMYIPFNAIMNVRCHVCKHVDFSVRCACHVCNYKCYMYLGYVCGAHVHVLIHVPSQAVVCKPPPVSGTASPGPPPLLSPLWLD